MTAPAIVFTCAACGTEQRMTMASATLAHPFLIKEHNWQHITYDFGHTEFTEYRCESCRILPARKTEDYLKVERSDYA